jgi:outer membrane protein TolC
VQPSLSAQQTSGPLSVSDVIRLALTQASAYQQAGINERIAAEDIRQAQIAFLPKVSAPLFYLYTSPEIGAPPGTPRIQSFVANNGIGEYQAFVSIGGDIDINGKLRATLARSRALLQAAHAGTLVARRALTQATIEAYYGVALAVAKRQSAEQSLTAAQEFEKITALLFSGGEVAQVDLTRAQLQSTQRLDDLEKARADEAVASASLSILIGYGFDRPVSVLALPESDPQVAEIASISADTITRRPEFAQFEAERRAAEQEIIIARADRRPSLSYSINGGFDTDSVRSPRLKEHTGVSAGISLNIPIFDFGASKSREQQARLRLQLAESLRVQAQRGLYQEFYAARTAALSAAARVRVARQGVQQAQSNLNASVARYRSGEAQIIEVTDAQTSLANERLAFYQALFDYQTARARLLQASGQ